MPEIQVRPATIEDIPVLVALDHGYTSDYVWQMELQRDELQVGIVFRKARLPRSVQVDYPREPKVLLDSWQSRDGLLVAILGDAVIGYTCLMQNMAPQTTWATDLVVQRRHRRQGIGTALLLAAHQWAMQHQSRRLIIEMQPKNDPAICLAEKLGFDLCGYNDHYFINRDIALFYSKWLR